MQAIRVYRLGDSPNGARLYLDGKRVSRDKWHTEHWARDCDSYGSRMQTLRNGHIVVREFHCIRIRSI